MAERTFDTCLVLHAEHGLNASTFASRVIGATLSDIYSAITGGIAALKGPLHGGANQEVMRMLLEIDHSGQRPGDYISAKLAKKERIMGFGHRVYKTMDPRASILKDMGKGLSEEVGSLKWYEMSLEMMEIMKAEKGLYPNVDFFSASIYYMLGIAIDLYTPIFALSRTAGWSAHLKEQWAHNRLIRPKAAYVGPQGKRTLPIGQRA
jgi:citrate synthase